MDFYVYIHRKKTTKEVFYVGKGKFNRAYEKTSRNKFWRSIVLKHGFIVEFVETGLQEWYAFELEQNLISYYGRRDCGEGSLVNATEGGEGTTGHFWSDELKEWRRQKTIEQFKDPAMRKKVSLARKGRKLTEKHRLSSIAALERGKEKQKETVSYLLKEKWKDPEFRQKMINMSLSKQMAQESRDKIAAALSKPVLRSDGVIFKSAAEAGRVLGKSHAKISMVANGKRNTAYGYKWEYV
jgi:hypothetical protein